MNAPPSLLSQLLLYPLYLRPYLAHVKKNMTGDTSSVVILGVDLMLGGGIAGRWLMLPVLLMVMMTQD